MGKTWYIGVDVGGTTVKLAFVDDEGHIIDKWDIQTDTSHDGKNITSDISESIMVKLKEHNTAISDIKGLGIGAPGFINMENGFIFQAVNIGWHSYPLKEELEKATGLPVILDNDANTAALGEMWQGAGNGAEDLLCVTLGTGVGGGVITRGEIVHGVTGMAGEIGHITVIPEGGLPCNCGKRGCLETVSSATGICRMAIEGLAEHPNSALKRIFDETGDLTSKDVFDAAKAQDTWAILVVENAAFHLGMTLASVAMTLNPSKIVIGGGVSKAGDVLINPVNHYFKLYSLPRVYEGAELVLAELGNDAGVIGGAWLAKTKL
ncbi:glucokinase [Scopulibacillus darangshiensis]|uniref:Glucokinase n=1 Tax=Scopulibacillus darangshiensis TaxID=442528 RepID=A0A4R2P890_9BACL|nr:ROK family glucokinase [Scopulibacillus darangshiensis]TCP31143.1 glucokinase [Scopulibacillus darangshiensis]